VVSRRRRVTEAGQASAGAVDSAVALEVAAEALEGADEAAAGAAAVAGGGGDPSK
jgi:hypothetical protein